MSETKCELKHLRRTLPAVSGEPEIFEDGEEVYRGFLDDMSPDPAYVADGHILLLASAIDPAMKIERSREVSKRVTTAAIAKVWEAAEKREEVGADFIGVADWTGSVDIAFVRDRGGRAMTLDVYLLAFCIRAVHPDALAVSAAPGGHQDASLALRRDGALVGLCMPLRGASESDFAQHDLTREPIDLQSANS